MTGFSGGSDGADPAGRVIVAPSGVLYGTTAYGNGTGCSHGVGCGVVFKLTPPSTICRSVSCPWVETTLYGFTGSSDGGKPVGDLALDQSGNIYGTTFEGGNGYGVVYELSPSGGGWRETILYAPRSDGDGAVPEDGVTIDHAGNLYGVFADNGPNGFGAVYELSRSGSGWAEQTVYGFVSEQDGSTPTGGLILDSAGNLYGTAHNGPGGDGIVYELSPSDHGWQFNTLYAFRGSMMAVTQPRNLSWIVLEICTAQPKRAERVGLERSSSCHHRTVGGWRQS